MIEHLLKTWRQQIPAMNCEPGCRECCEGDARAMTLAEWRAIAHPGKYAAGPALTSCPFLDAAGCAIYARRPLICRLFGAVAPTDPALLELEGTFPIACLRGYYPESPLPLAAALKIQVAYQEYANRELQKVIGDWLKYLKTVSSEQSAVNSKKTEDRRPKTEDRPPALPEKFEWLRYVLSTREGQTTLRLLSGQTVAPIDPEKMARMTAMLSSEQLPKTVNRKL